MSRRARGHWRKVGRGKYERRADTEYRSKGAAPTTIRVTATAALDEDGDREVFWRMKVNGTVGGEEYEMGLPSNEYRADTLWGAKSFLDDAIRDGFDE